MKFVTSDTHFFDTSIIKHYNFAPARSHFFNVNDMNFQIIRSWNSVVSGTDLVYHCGDIGVYYKSSNKEALLSILMQLHGSIIFIKGNHDSRDLFKYLQKNNFFLNEKNGIKKFYFHNVGTYFKYNHRQFFLTHYPLFFGKTQNSINLHGHIHYNSIPIKENINIGVDSKDFDYFPKKEKPTFGTPLSMQQIEFLIKAKSDDFYKRR